MQVWILRDILYEEETLSSDKVWYDYRLHYEYLWYDADDYFLWDYLFGEILFAHRHDLSRCYTIWILSLLVVHESFLIPRNRSQESRLRSPITSSFWCAKRSISPLPHVSVQDLFRRPEGMEANLSIIGSFLQHLKQCFRSLLDRLLFFTHKIKRAKTKRLSVTVI